MGARPVAQAMARYIRDRTANVTLQRSSHGSQEYHRAKPNRPPARATGALSKAMQTKPAHEGIRATAYVMNRIEYGRILEYGCFITPKHGEFLHWIDSAGSWYHDILIVPPHPFLGPTTEEAIRDNELQDAAIEAFRPYDP